MDFKVVGTILNLFHYIGSIGVRMDKTTGNLHLVKKKRWIRFNQFAIFLAVLRWVYLVIVLIQVISGQLKIPGADIIRIGQMVTWFTLSNLVHLIFFNAKKQIVHFFNLYLHLQNEAEDKWPGKFDCIWHNSEKLFKYALITTQAVGNVIIFLGMLTNPLKPLHTSFLFNPSFVSRLLFACLDIYMRIFQTGVGTLVIYIILAYIFTTKKGLDLLRSENLSACSIALFRKYELVNKAFNQWCASIFMPMLIGVSGIALVAQFCVVVKATSSLDFGSYFEYSTGLYFNILSSGLFMFSAASIHKSTVLILRRWNRSNSNTGIGINSTKNGSHYQERAGNLMENANSKIEIDDTNVDFIISDIENNPNMSKIEEGTAMSVNRESAKPFVYGSPPRDDKTDLKRIVKSIKPFGVQVAHFYILKMSTVTNFYQINIDLAINILLATKGLKI